MARNPRDGRDDRDESPEPQPAPAPPVRRVRGRALFALPSILLALLAIAALVPTIRSAPPAPPPREPLRYPSGQPAAERLIVILAPQLDERDLLLLRSALLPQADPLVADGAVVTIGRPSFMSFDDISLVLLAGNGPSAATTPGPAGQSPDTLVRSVIGEGKRAAVLGPPEWRALFGTGDAPGASAAPAVPKAGVLLRDTATMLASHEAMLVVVQLRDLAARDVRDEAGNVRDAAEQVGAQLGPRDILLLVGGGGAIGEPLHLAVSGAGVKPAHLHTLDLNDVAPTCAVLLGMPYPVEARGRIAWGLIEADTRRKAEATAGLARQRAALVVAALPFGVPYSASLRDLQLHLAQGDAAIAAGQVAYGYQLAGSNLAEADRQLEDVAGSAPLPAPRRAAWALAIPCLVAALLALALALLARAWGTLAAGLGGAAVALVVWLAFVIFLQRVIVPNLATVVALTAAHACCGGLVCAWIARHWARFGPTLAIDLLVVLVAFPVALCAYRYGLPWQLRLEEATPLFLWRSALLAPAGLLLAGYGAAAILARYASHAGPHPAA
jgi:hypothetical protein